MLFPALFLAALWAGASAAPLSLEDLSMDSSFALAGHKRDVRYPTPNSLKGNTSGVHDPTMVKTPEGSYLLYGSGGWYNEFGNNVGFGIPTWSSSDQVVSLGHLIFPYQL